jgi:hypothetical protein
MVPPFAGDAVHRVELARGLELPQRLAVVVEYA